MAKTINQGDAFICGGGPVGLMLAIGLALKGHSVVLAESVALDDVLTGGDEPSRSSFDGRVLALSHGSRLVLEKLQVWADVQTFVTEIQHVHVSQKGYLGVTTLNADEVGVPALGYSIQSSDLGRVLWQHVRKMATVTVLCPAELVDFCEKGDRIHAKVQMGSGEEIEVQAGLIIGADGTHSRVRTILGLPMQEKSYHAFGVIAQIETQQHPEGWSYERFTEQGPVALLPMQDHFHKAVLVCPEEEIESLMALNDEAFMDLFAEKMGERLGAYTQVSKRVAYPLKETYVEQMNSGRAVLMGNASHTQHPVAAQGLNLGIRDIDVFLEGLETQADIGDPQYLADYAEQRKSDHESVMGLTDSLIQVFQHTSPLVGHLRGIGMMALQAMPGLRKRFARFAMGGRRS
ncbi:FAD-dependent monooxygenase [Thiomicrorhabdus sp. ZW0627]|uniref:FAD-dependent monooxygenase n=1 Tax=Thiomicrorhabdus sp. ZW0627 TaxID=3039774 RepID=UPI002436FD10|nr:FAD-dependent monooxygenase [Thiomicrorhabdus sp. ZW0627]MDG6773228.1 FAD-dependent monooxygenase [Thiomicrorhabdus sp. ZW0627]